MSFNAQQTALLRALARQTADFPHLRISFTRTRLLLRFGPTEDAYATNFALLFVAGILLVLFFGLAVANREWLLAGGLALLLAGGTWLGLRLWRGRLARPTAPPDFVYDLPEHSFYYLRHPPDGPAAYDRYPAQLLTATRTEVLEVTRYGADTAVELSFGNQWLRLCRVGSELAAKEIAQTIWRCKEFREAPKSPAS